VFLKMQVFFENFFKKFFAWKMPVFSVENVI